CHEFQTRQCNLSGRFIFFIPGIKSIDAFELHTNSFYAMSRAIEQFETLAFLRGGRISGFLDAKRTPFYLTKKLRDVPHIDETGRAVRAAHWIIELEAPIDVTTLRRADDDDSVLANANEAAHVLEGARHGADLEKEGAKAFGSDVLDLNGNPSSDDVGIGHLVESPPNARGDQAVAATPRKATATHQGRNPAASHDSAPSKEQVIAAAGEFGIDAVRYEAYAECHWGPGWMLNANGRLRALDEIARYKNDPDTFVDKVDAELTAAQKPI
ncbi:MAG TPA: hypothetical protein VJ654_12340, partial [Noviherbaspirillum sp.]|nr:hypothetical protein [Noviherbaspirillum sp.]